MVSAGSVRLCVDARLLSEYGDVLNRPRFRFDPDAVAALIDFIDANSDTAAASPLSIRLPDADDEAFLEVALACSADRLVTGNIVHFPERARLGVSVVTPAELIEIYRSYSDQGDVTVDYLEQRAARGDRAKFERAMRKMSDAEPDEGDE